jgi:hypothetical protein
LVTRFAKRLSLMAKNTNSKSIKISLLNMIKPWFECVNPYHAL